MSSENRLISAVHTVARVLSTTVNLDEALKRTLQASMEAVDASGGSILIHNQRTRELVFRHVVGEKAEELQGIAIPDSKGIAGQVFQTAQAQVDDDVRKNPTWGGEVDDDVVTSNMVTVPVTYPTGERLGVIQVVNKRSGCFTDEDLTVLEIVSSISAMSFQNSELSDQTTRLAVLQHVGSIAHDVKNKTLVIGMSLDTLQPQLEGLCDRLRSIATDEEVASIQADISEYLDMIRVNANDATRYTRFLADMAKGKEIEVCIEPSNLVAAVTHPFGGLQKNAEAAGIVLKAVYDEEFAIPCDTFLIERAVFNLINNALPETPPGGTITVEVWQEEPRWAVIEVRDTGRGMPKRILDSILDGNATSTKAGGTGLGTKMVKSVAEAHSGEFEGESQEGKGTAFRIKLPLT